MNAVAEQEFEEFEALVTTNIKATEGVAQSLSGDSKLEAPKGSRLRAVVLGESAGHVQLAEASLNGLPVAPHLKFAYKTHWRRAAAAPAAGVVSEPVAEGAAEVVAEPSIPAPQQPPGAVPLTGSDGRISYWRKGQRIQNFGDLLSELLYGALTRSSLLDRKAGTPRGNYDVIHLIGSVISTEAIHADLEHARAGSGWRIAYWGCGMRNTRPISRELLESCAFFGVRGPLTRDALGLGPATPIGDPALLLPLLYRPHTLRQVTGKTLCVPHILDGSTEKRLLEKSGADLIVRPGMGASLDHVQHFIDTITSADFVLAGALHAAIVAAAYGVPFAYFHGDYIDVPFKWQDFASSMSIPHQFLATAEEGISFYQNEIKPSLKSPKLEPLVDCAPLMAPRELLARARKYDAGGGRY